MRTWMAGLMVGLLTLLISSPIIAVDQELTPKQKEKLASVQFNQVKSVSVGEMLAVSEIPTPAADVVVLNEAHFATVLKWISMPESYSFGGTAACFSPGMRITISEASRTVILDVCLECEKMSVAIDKQPKFMMDFSALGLALYKSIYFDHVVQAKKKTQTKAPAP